MQDTSQLTYSTQYKKQGIGPLKNKYQKGILLHPTLAVTPSKLCLGVIDDYHWFREKLLNVKKKERSQLNLKTPITEKESYRWILSSQKMNQLAKELPEQQFINIADREGDIYELYHEASSQQRAPNLDYLIRAVKNRPLLNQQSGKKSATNLWDTIQNESAKYQIKFKLPKRGNKPSRWVTQVLRSKTVCLLPPYRRKGLAPLPSLQMNAVIASEINPPANEKPIKWLFLTSLPITTPEELKLILNFYLCRWQIEVFFKVLKSGCQVEKLQLTTLNRMEVCLALYLIIAWRILFIMHLGRQAPDSTCDIIFDTEEWQILYCLVSVHP